MVRMSILCHQHPRVLGAIYSDTEESDDADSTVEDVPEVPQAKEFASDSYLVDNCELLKCVSR